jgi:hypothetical protein
MNTLATVVPYSGDNQNIVHLTHSNGACQNIIRLARWRPLSAADSLLSPADINNVRPVLYSLLDRSCEIQLGEASLLVVAKDRDDETPAMRRDPADGPARLPEDQARDVRTVCRHRSTAGCV